MLGTALAGFGGKGVQSVTRGDSDSESDSDSDSESDSDSAVEAVEFAEAEVFFEYNSTDLDLGIHIFFDAVGWTEVEVEGPDGSIFEVENGGMLSTLGSTEVFTESAEPPLDEDNLEEDIARFKAMFPEGEYEFEGETIGGADLEGTATLSHALPAAPMMLFPDPEAEENIADPDDTVIEWMDASEIGDPEIVRYEIVVEFDTGEHTEGEELDPLGGGAVRSLVGAVDQLAGFIGRYRFEMPIEVLVQALLGNAFLAVEAVAGVGASVPVAIFGLADLQALD